MAGAGADGGPAAHRLEPGDDRARQAEGRAPHLGGDEARAGVDDEHLRADGVARPLFGASALLSILTSADGYVVVPDDATGLGAGSQVDVTLYR